MDKYQEIKKDYDSLLSLVRDRLPGQESETSFSLFYMAAVLKIWGSNLFYSPDYGALLSVVSGTDYTIEQLVTAMNCCGDQERQLRIPEFFQKMVDRDRGDDSTDTGDMIQKINRLLAASAMVNGDFTPEKAAALTTIIKGLTRYGSAAGIRMPSEPLYCPTITRRNEQSYLQNDALLQAARKKKPLPKHTLSPKTLPKKAPSQKTPPKHPDPEEENRQSEPPVPLTINIHLTAAGPSEENPADARPSAEKEPSPPSAPETEEEETMESLLAELDGLVGLESVKQDVHSLMNFIRVARIREKRGMKVPAISYHLVFTGNPGTGKTTVARLVAKLYYHMGILPQGQLEEADRSTLVAGYLGQTAIKTQKVFQKAMGGVLFIDEAYSLAGETEDSYGKEAIETLLKAMEDHRDELVVIVAGYTELMHKFIESNPGLSSRFSKYFEFSDYSGEELLSIFCRFCQKNGYLPDNEALQLLKQKFDTLYANRDRHFGNARAARNIFEKAINAQADRLALQNDLSDADLETLTAQDILTATGGDVKCENKPSITG